MDDLTMHETINYEDGKMVPRARLWIKKKMYKPSFAAAEPLLYFLDKYATIVVGGVRAMGKYYKNNRGKTLLDKLTVSDIAYSLLVYESSYDVWSEEMDKAKTCTTAEEKKLYQGTAKNKYHVKRGARLPLYQDGWTNEGQNYYKEMCAEFQAIKNNDTLWATLNVHWKTYTKKYHKYSYVVLEETDIGMESKQNKEPEVNNDDDCIVSLPGELDNDNIEFDDEYSDDGDNNNDYSKHAAKRQKMWPV